MERANITKTNKSKTKKLTYYIPIDGKANSTHILSLF